MNDKAVPLAMIIERILITTSNLDDFGGERNEGININSESSVHYFNLFQSRHFCCFKVQEMYLF